MKVRVNLSTVPTLVNCRPCIVLASSAEERSTIRYASNQTELKESEAETIAEQIAVIDRRQSCSRPQGSEGVCP
jgi:hypothetical protein